MVKGETDIWLNAEKISYLSEKPGNLQKVFCLTKKRWGEGAEDHSGSPSFSGLKWAKSFPKEVLKTMKRYLKILFPIKGLYMNI